MLISKYHTLKFGTKNLASLTFSTILSLKHNSSLNVTLKNIECQGKRKGGNLTLGSTSISYTTGAGCFSEEYRNMFVLFTLSRCHWTKNVLPTKMVTQHTFWKDCYLQRGKLECCLPEGKSCWWGWTCFAVSWRSPSCRHLVDPWRQVDAFPVELNNSALINLRTGTNDSKEPIKMTKKLTN